MPTQRESTERSETTSPINTPRPLSVEDLRAVDPSTRLQMISAIEDTKTRVDLLNQLTPRERGDLMAAEMVSNLNSRTQRNEP